VDPGSGDRKALAAATEAKVRDLLARDLPARDLETDVAGRESAGNIASTSDPAAR
jgi:1-acyl-sn-glycerol-3-phosphate acyltransferase